jgi:nicotinate-nucleotide--dimethylbenzimidazole phosphoribosyltransferase
MNFPDLPALAEPELRARVQHALDHKTKPLGAASRRWRCSWR